MPCVVERAASDIVSSISYAPAAATVDNVQSCQGQEDINVMLKHYCMPLAVHSFHVRPVCRKKALPRTINVKKQLR